MFTQRPNRHYALTPGEPLPFRFHGFYCNADGTVTLTDEDGASVTYTVLLGQQVVMEFTAYVAATGAINTPGGLVGFRETY